MPNWQASKITEDSALGNALSLTFGFTIEVWGVIKNRLQRKV